MLLHVFLLFLVGRKMAQASLARWNTEKKIAKIVAGATTKEAKKAFLEEARKVIDEVGGAACNKFIKDWRAVDILGEAADEDHTLAGCRETILNYFRTRLGFQRISASACEFESVKFTEAGDVVAGATANESPEGRKTLVKVRTQQRRGKRRLNAINKLLSGEGAATWCTGSDPRDNPTLGLSTARQILKFEQLLDDQIAYVKALALSEDARSRRLAALALVESPIMLSAYDTAKGLVTAARDALAVQVADGTTEAKEFDAISAVDLAVSGAFDVLSGQQARAGAKAANAYYACANTSFLAPYSEDVGRITAAARDEAGAHETSAVEVVELVKKGFNHYLDEALTLVESSERAAFISAQMKALCAELDVIAKRATVARLWKLGGHGKGATARNNCRLLHVLVARVHLYMIQAQDVSIPLHYPTLDGSGLDVLKQFVEYAAARSDELLAQPAPKPTTRVVTGGVVTGSMKFKRAKALQKWLRHTPAKDGSLAKLYPAGGIARVRAMLSSQPHTFEAIPTGPMTWSDLTRMTDVFAAWEEHCDEASLDPLTARPRE